MSLTGRILLLVLLALAPALAIQGYNEHALRASRDEVIRADTMATARTVAEDLAQVAENVRQALDYVAQDPGVRGLDPSGCTDYLRRAVANSPHLALIALTRADGTVICNSVGSAAGAYTNAERAYHKRALARDGFVMGNYVKGMATGKSSLHFARPLKEADGRIIGVLVAAIDLDWFGNYLQRNLRLPSTSVTVADEDKTIMVRYPDGTAWIGKPIPEERQRLLMQRGEGVRVDLGIDGRERVLANAHPSGPAAAAWITVGRDRKTAYADIDAATRRGVVLIALGAALAIAAALLAGRLFIRRPVDRLLRTANAWKAGDLFARTGLDGPDEFGRLGTTLDGMAASLQRHEGELREEVRNGRAMQERQVTMLHELNHRVKNTLATVQALARQSTRGGDAPGEQLEARILALSKTHDLLTRDDWSGAPLRAVLENEIGPYRGGDNAFVVEGPDVDLPPRHVLSLGMTLHELVTNAVKHGALSVAGGGVRVTWSVTAPNGDERRLRLEWTETGGPAAVPPTRRGFGTRLIAVSVERELDGAVALDFTEGGLRVAIDVPMTGSGASHLSPLGTVH